MGDRWQAQAASSRLEVALRRLAVGYRVVGALWLTLLALVSLAPAGSGQGADPVVVGAAISLAIAWTVLTTVVAARRPATLRSASWLAADVAVAAAMVAAPSVAGAGAAAFYGGYPFSAVILAATGRGLVGGLATGGVLAAVAVVRASAEGVVALPEALGSVLLYLAGGGLVAWGAGVLRQQDAERRTAEAALAVERAQRIRSQERTETAAHLHDSVLQDLALIQRRSGDPAEVITLARRSERELRGWLAGGPALHGQQFAATVKAAAAEVEAAHTVSVDAVTVGDAPLDEQLAALVAAAREAMLNAAKHAGVARLALYAEVGETHGEVFVRDRGKGFDPVAVAPDRRGIAVSIVERLRRHGGEATVRSAPGEGTEVRLRVPRHPASA